MVPFFNRNLGESNCCNPRLNRFKTRLRITFGQPVIAEEVPTAEIVGLTDAGKDIEAVADEYAPLFRFERRARATTLLEVHFEIVSAVLGDMCC
jgi:uncharacterized protein (DUF433 family)